MVLPEPQRKSCVETGCDSNSSSNDDRNGGCSVANTASNFDNLTTESDAIEVVVAQLRGFSPEEPIEDAVVYYWESHTDGHNDKKKHQATIDLIYKEFNMHICEKYEIRTGYLSRYNYLQRPYNESSPKEMEEAIRRGAEEEKEWIKRCNPRLPGFVEKEWENCISAVNNPHFEECRALIMKKIRDDEEFANAFSKCASDYTAKHGNNLINSNLYLIEETSWVLNLPLLHLNKPIYIVHVGAANIAMLALFHHFPNLSRAVRFLAPRFSIDIYHNVSEFLLAYRGRKHVGYSYAIENRNALESINRHSQDRNLTKEELLHMLEYERSEKDLLRSIISKFPGHIYWLNQQNVYLGCNELQAQHLGLSSQADIIGKTNADLHAAEDANRLNSANIGVIETCKLLEVEEEVLVDSQNRIFLSQKTPLFNKYGEVVGILGLSVDITSRRKAEELRLKNEIQRVEIRKQKELQKIAIQMADCISAHAADIELILNSCEELSGKRLARVKNLLAGIKEAVGSLKA